MFSSLKGRTTGASRNADQNQTHVDSDTGTTKQKAMQHEEKQ